MAFLGRIIACCLFLAGGLWGPSAASAQHNIENCNQYIPRGAGNRLLDWRETVRLEHCDRRNRINRISSLLSKSQQPQFYVTTLRADQLPPGFDVNMPLLRVVFPDRVFFDTDRSVLRPEAREVVQIVAESLRREPPDVALFVAGHADARGDRIYNQNLSIDRANAVAAAILAEGVNQASVWRVGFGEDMPLVPGNNTYAYGQNRRVEFLFAARPEAIAVWMADLQVDLLCQGRTERETAGCRQQLDLRQDYVAIELDERALQIIPGETATNVDVISQGRRAELDQDGTQVVIEGQGGQQDVQASGATPGLESRLLIVTPLSTRRIRIDPVNRRYTPVRDD